MSTFVVNRGTIRGALGVWLAAWVLLAAGTSHGQTVSPTTQPAKPDVKPARAEKAKPPRKTEVELKKPPAPTKGQRGTTGRASKNRRSAEFTPDPNAKWACDKTEVTLEPVWRDEKALTFDFMIRNEGTADLRIRAKGG